VDSSKEGIGHININDMYDKTYYFIELLKKLSKFSGITIKVVSTGVVQFDEYNPDLHPENSLLVGIAQTAAKEFTNLTILPIAISQINQDNVKLLKFESNIDNPLYQPVLYFKGDRYVRKLVYYRVPYTKRSSFRNNGSYIIFGGLGGIGFELSKYLLKNYNANLILVGRSNADNDKLNKIKDLGGKVTYERVNLLDKQELSDLLAKFTVDGIIHSALTLEDKTLQFMSKETLYKVLDPKVKGAINLYTSIIENNLNPDFILFFSSIQSFIANSGQANYTAACVFKDTLAHLLRNYEIQNTKIINWGYWGSVGIVSSDEYRNRMKSLGIGSIE
jgi:polyketide synthase PksN